MTTELRILLATPDAIMPTRGSEHAAGIDLYASEDKYVKPQSVGIVSTGVHVEIPTGWYGRIADRSSMAMLEWRVGGGVIDSDYRGELKIMLYNHAQYDRTIARGNKVAQLILEKIPDNIALVRVQTLDSTKRGEAGFGSTGK